MLVRVRAFNLADCPSGQRELTVNQPRKLREFESRIRHRVKTPVLRNRGFLFDAGLRPVVPALAREWALLSCLRVGSPV